MSLSPQPSIHRSLTLGAAGFLAAQLVVAAPAHAVVAPMPPSANGFLSVHESPPAGGVIMGNLSCIITSGQGTCGISLPVFSDSLGQQISGDFVEHVATDGSTGAAGIFIFRPEVPLSPGEYSATSSVSASSPYFTSIFSATTTTTFEMREATDELPTVEVLLNTQLTSAGPPVSCIETSPSRTAEVFYEELLTQAKLSVVPSGPNDRQYAYATALSGETPEELSPWASTRLVEGEPAEICVSVVGRSYLDDSVVELESDCLSTEALDLGLSSQVNTSSPDGHVSLDNIDGVLSGCVIPPLNYEDEWCAYFVLTFDNKNCAGYDMEACFAARAACPDGDAPSAEEIEAERAPNQDPMGSGGGDGIGAAGGADTGGNGGDLGASAGTEAGNGELPGGTGASEGESEGESEDWGTPSGSFTSESEEAGCSVSPLRTQSSSWLWSVFACALWMRRKRGRP